MAFQPSNPDEQRIRNIHYRIDEAWQQKFHTDHGPNASELQRAIIGAKGKDHTPDRSSISKILLGNRDRSLYNPGASVLIAIADALDTTVDALLGYAQDRESLENAEIEAKYGLSSKALSYLSELKSQSHNNRTYATILWLINYIFEHSCITNDKNVVVDDFLLTLMRLVSCRFSEYNSNLIEALLYLTTGDSYNEVEAYRQIITETERINNGTAASEPLSINGLKNDIREINEKQKIQIRKKYILCESQKQYNKDIVDSYLSNGIIPMFDPVTNDEVWFQLPSPQNALKENLLRIIDNWHSDYMNTVYSANKRKVTSLIDIHEYNNESISSLEELEAAEQPSGDRKLSAVEKHLYRNLYTYNLATDQLKLYLAFEYIERTALQYMILEENGRLFFPNRMALPDKDFIEIITAASEAKTGLYFGDDGEVYFDAEKASDPDSRLKYEFETYCLPAYYEAWLQAKKPSESYRRMLYVDYNRYSKDKYKEIMASARKAELDYKISLEYVDIIGKKYDPDEKKYWERNDLKESQVLSIKEQPNNKNGKGNTAIRRKNSRSKE